MVIPVNYCPVCHSSPEERAEIDAAIKANRESFDSIARRIGVTRRVVQRHRDHMDETTPTPAPSPPIIMVQNHFHFHHHVNVMPAADELADEHSSTLETNGSGDPEHLEEEELLGSIADRGEGGYA
jgi:transposase-like protein